jgi:hypothetical protein
MGKKNQEDKNDNNKPDYLPTAEDLAHTDMTAKQFCTWLKLMGWDNTEEKLSQAGIALGKTTRQLRYYTSGAKSIPRSVALACLLLIQKPNSK